MDLPTDWYPVLGSLLCFSRCPFHQFKTLSHTWRKQSPRPESPGITTKWYASTKFSNTGTYQSASVWIASNALPTAVLMSSSCTRWGWPLPKSHSASFLPQALAANIISQRMNFFSSSTDVSQYSSMKALKMMDCFTWQLEGPWVWGLGLVAMNAQI